MRIVKKFLLALLLLLIVYMLTITSLFPQCSGTLVWSDEFSGSSLDLSKWTYDIGNGCPSLCGWGNNELEYYTNSTNNVRVSGGNLIIEARSESMGGASFTSGKIKTLGLVAWTYGRFEARMRLPQGRGLWPAFWMLNVNNNWPMTGEIDIMEYRGDIVNRTSATLHYGSAWPNNQYDGTDYFLPTGNFYSEWHIFAVEWEANEIRWYLDNVRIKTETRVPNSLNPPSTNDPWPWDEDFYIILNLAVGGWFTGVTDPADVQLIKPTLEVDYVRVYEISSSANYQVPYWGTPVSFPARVQAEEFDRGCGDAAFYDTDLNNNGGQFRQEKVDIENTTDAGGGYNVGWIQTGEWMEYTINVPAGGTYDFIIRASSGVGGGRLRIEMDGVTIGTPVTVNNTGGWQNWQNYSLTNISLTPGVKVMRVFAENAGFNLNYIDVSVNTLPVVFTFFNVERINNEEVLITWETSGEKDNSHFEVERSLDGSDWKYLGKILGSGSTLQRVKYTFADMNVPFSSNLYYRIKQVDFDGSENYSVIKNLDPLNEIFISVNSMIFIEGCPGKNFHLILISSDGKILQNTRDPFLKKPEKPGIYFLQILGEELFYSGKIFIDNH